MADDYSAIKEHARSLEEANAARNTMFRRMEDIYHLKWKERAVVSRQFSNIKITLSPRPRNAIKGMVRLLVAADPKFSIPHDTNDLFVTEQSDRLERAARALWWVNGRIKGDPIHYDVVLSAALYAETHIAMTSTKDLQDWAKKSGDGVKRRAEAIAQKTPFIFEVWNPSQGYPEWDQFGLRAFHRKVQKQAGEIEDTWGTQYAKVIGKAGRNLGRYDMVTLNHFYDLKYQVLWLSEAAGEPLLIEEHNLPFIPVVAQITEGSRLFERSEEQRDPFLNTVDKSGLWNRENLLLTIAGTHAFSIGANPMFVNYLLDPNDPPDVDWSVPGGSINMKTGERREQIVPNVINPDLQQFWQTVTQLEEDSTIYRQALGEPLGASTPYSSVALLSQTGRLPLNMPQRKSSWAIAEAVEKAFQWMRIEKLDGHVRMGEQEVIIKGSEIPEHFELDVSLDIALPQDKLMLSQIAIALTQGDNPLASRRWAREKVLDIPQSDPMTAEIWDEQSEQIMYQRYLIGEVAKLAADQQAAMAPPGPGQGVIPGGPPAPSGQETPQLVGQASPPMPQQFPENLPLPPISPIPPLVPPGVNPPGPSPNGGRR